MFPHVQVPGANFSPTPDSKPRSALSWGIHGPMESRGGGGGTSSFCTYAKAGQCLTPTFSEAPVQDFFHYYTFSGFLAVQL